MVEPWFTVCRSASFISWSSLVSLLMRSHCRTCTIAYVSFLKIHYELISITAFQRKMGKMRTQLHADDRACLNSQVNNMWKLAETPAVYWISSIS